VDPTQSQPLDGPGANLAARLQVWSGDGLRLLADFAGQSGDATADFCAA
jgi:hypothetical protein